MQQLKIIIIDDDKEVHELLTHYLQKLDIGIDFHIHPPVTSSSEAIQLLTTSEFDISFIDIQLPDNLGLTIVNHVPIENIGGVIYMSDFGRKYFEQLVEIDDLNFISKPLSELKVSNAIKKFLKQRDKNKTDREMSDSVNVILTLQGKIIRKYTMNNIAYIKANGDTSVAYFAMPIDGQESVTLSIGLSKVYDSYFSESSFLRVHNSYIVNLLLIQEIRPLEGRTGKLVLKNGMTIDYSETYKQNLLTAWKAVP